MDEAGLIDNRTAKIFANATPDWVIWRLIEHAGPAGDTLDTLRLFGVDRVYEMRAIADDGRVFAISYGMTHAEEQERILTGVNPRKHFVVIEALAIAAGKVADVVRDSVTANRATLCRLLRHP